MLFNTINYILFLPVVCLFYYIMPAKMRWYVLLAASIFFYSFFGWENLLLLIGVGGISFFTGKWIENAKKKEIPLVLSLLLFLGYLFLFKYFNFFNIMIARILGFVEMKNPIPLLHLLMPVGISYYIFQAIGYHVDIYYGKIKPETNPLKLQLFFLFFPKILQGPVERSRNIIPQFEETHTFSYESFVDGIRRIIWGIFQKVVVADRIAVLVSNVYVMPSDFNGFSLTLAAVLFTFQLYFDFMGYTDIAIGTARLFGITIMENFNKPFSAKNITEYWRRWHISLSTWLNEYLFNPMVISLRNWGMWGTIFAVFFTFVLAGLWHGAGMTFLFYGALHGLALAYEILTKKQRKKWSKKIPSAIYNNASTLLTFMYASFSLILFRTKDLAEVRYIFSTIFKSWSSDLHAIFQGGMDSDRGNVLYLYAGQDSFFIVVGLIFMMMVIERIIKGPSYKILALPNIYVRWAIYFITLAIIITFGVFHSEAEFIYVNF